MSFQGDPDTILWRLHLKPPPDRVYRVFSTDAGRAAFWAESAEELLQNIHSLTGRAHRAGVPVFYVQHSDQ